MAQAGLTQEQLEQILNADFGISKSYAVLLQRRPFGVYELFMYPERSIAVGQCMRVYHNLNRQYNINGRFAIPDGGLCKVTNFDRTYVWLTYLPIPKDEASVSICLYRDRSRESKYIWSHFKAVQKIPSSKYRFDLVTR